MERIIEGIWKWQTHKRTKGFFQKCVEMDVGAQAGVREIDLVLVFLCFFIPLCPFLDWCPTLIPWCSNRKQPFKADSIRRVPRGVISDFSTLSLLIRASTLPQVSQSKRLLYGSQGALLSKQSQARRAWLSEKLRPLF